MVALKIPPGRSFVVCAWWFLQQIQALGKGRKKGSRCRIVLLDGGSEEKWVMVILLVIVLRWCCDHDEAIWLIDWLIDWSPSALEKKFFPSVNEISDPMEFVLAQPTAPRDVMVWCPRSVLVMMGRGAGCESYLSAVHDPFWDLTWMAGGETIRARDRNPGTLGGKMMRSGKKKERLAYSCNRVCRWSECRWIFEMMMMMMMMVMNNRKKDLCRRWDIHDYPCPAAGRISESCLWCACFCLAHSTCIRWVWFWSRGLLGHVEIGRGESPSHSHASHHTGRKLACRICEAGRSDLVVGEMMSLFGDFGKGAVGWWTWARRVLGLLWAIVVVWGRHSEWRRRRTLEVKLRKFVLDRGLEGWLGVGRALMLGEWWWLTVDVYCVECVEWWSMCLLWEMDRGGEERVFIMFGRAVSRHSWWLIDWTTAAKSGCRHPSTRNLVSGARFDDWRYSGLGHIHSMRQGLEVVRYLTGWLP